MKLLRSPLEKRLKDWHGEEWHTSKGRVIRDIVYAVDTGLVTTVSFLAGVTASLVTRDRIILAGLIEVTSGTLAIFFGSYISTKAQKHFFENQIERERKEIEEDPEKETEEIRNIFSDMGFTPPEQEIAVKRITANKERWLRFMVQEEIGITPGIVDNPIEIGIISAIFFVVGAIPGILPFFIFDSAGKALAFSAIFVLTFLFVMGVAKTRITKAHWFLSGIETLMLGALSCSVGFLLGKFAVRYFN